MSTATCDATLTELLNRLADQVEVHPPSTWSAGLLRIVTEALALEFGGNLLPRSGEMVTGKPRLSLVTEVQR